MIANCLYTFSRENLYDYDAITSSSVSYTAARHNVPYRDTTVKYANKQVLKYKFNPTSFFVVRFGFFSFKLILLGHADVLSAGNFYGLAELAS